MTDEEMTPQQRAAETKRKRTRDWIITSTLDLYGDLEHGDFTREQIAEAAGVGLTTLSNHFRAKWEVLRAAHERLLAPIIQPIVQGQENGTYNPTDGVYELIRYIYSITKMSHEHRALTVAMVRAYFETPPENRPELYGILDHDLLLAGHIATGMYPILMNPPFAPEGFFGAALRKRITQRGSYLYHATALLMEIYHFPNEDAPMRVTRTTCGELLPVELPETYDLSMLNRINEIQPKVDEQFKRWKQRAEMQGFE